MNPIVSRALRALAAVALLTSLAPVSVNAADEPVLHVATITIDGGAQVLYAESMGFFKKAGLNVEIQRLTNGPAIVAAVLGGASDIGFASTFPIVVAFKKNVPVTIIAPAGLYSRTAPQSICATPPDSPIRSPKELNGKTMATNGLKNIGEYGPRAWIDNAGGDSSTVKFVEMPFSEIPDALAAHRVDVAMVTEPYVQGARKKGRFIANCLDAIAPYYLSSAYFADVTWAKNHPDLIRRFQDVMRETAIWAAKNHAESGEILAREAKLDPSIINQMVRVVYGTAQDPKVIQPVIDNIARYGGISSTFPASDLLYQAPAH